MTNREITAKEHISKYATTWNGRTDWWLPAVYSERDLILREKLVEELGEPQPSGYMSEECGWRIDPDDYGLTDEAD